MADDVVTLMVMMCDYLFYFILSYVC